MANEHTSNNFHTTGVGAITAIQPTASLLSVAGIPATPFRGVWAPPGANPGEVGDPTEIVLVTNVTGTTITQTRGYELVPGTGPGVGVTHDDGDIFAAVYTEAGLLQLLIDGTAPVTQAFGDAAAAGTALVLGLRDHRHGMPVISAGSAQIVVAGTTANRTIDVGTGIPESSVTNLVADLAAKLVNPLTTTGDLIYSSSGTTAARLGVGGAGQVLTVSGGLPSWQNSVSGFVNPMTAVGDLIAGGTAGAAQRLAVGTVGQVLTVVSGAPAWANASTGFVNPMTTLGDLITAAAGGTAQRLGVGTTTQALVVTGGVPAWGNTVASVAPGSGKILIGGSANAPTVDVGTGIPESSITNLTADLAAKLGNPLTTTGDIIYSSAGTTAARLGIGATNQVLTVVGGIPAWAAATGGFTNPMTTLGDIITGAAAGAAQRLAVGSNNQVLTVVSGIPAWAAASGGGVATVTAGDGTITIGGTSVNPTVAVAAIAESQVTNLVRDLNGKAGRIFAASSNVVVAGGITNPDYTVDLAPNPSVTSLTASNGITITANGLTVTGGNITAANGSQIGPSGGSYTVKSGANTSNLNLANGANNNLVLTGVASAVNFSTFTTSVTGARVIWATSGTDANVGLNLSLKGTGDLAINGNAGTVGQVLTSNGTGASPTWSTSTALTNPMTTAGDMITATAGGTPSRLPIGTTGNVLTVVGTTPTWVAPVTGFANPMTTAGDMIVGTTGGVAQRLAIGGANQALTVVAGVPAWAAVVASVAAASGKIVIGGSANSPTIDVGTGIPESAITNLTADLAAKVTSVSATAPIASSGGATPTVSLNSAIPFPLNIPNVDPIVHTYFG